MMASDERATAWRFRFWLEHQEDDSPVSEQLAEELMNWIVDWAESRGLQVGGGFRAETDESS